ncbi:protein FAM184B isoform X2 [Cynoglossus semilaevis]|uniref:protein FAM184B isoform X2 n=1 Tax=Cynoglossus semilaevis TaxID=244447 RepID=UPI000494F032|nr:trichohyalin-like isoform X2 [Cynoglossus semilaevis]
MASGAGKAAQSPGPGSAVNGTAADFPNIEQELYDYQMHSKMCKKIAQLTKVIYSLNMRNEEQEAALQASSQAHHEELHRILMETCHEGEGSTLRTRLLELQESLDEQQRVGAQVQADFECFRIQAEESQRETEVELRKHFEDQLQATGEKLQEAKTQICASQEESLRLSKELERAEEQIQRLGAKCEELQNAADKEKKRQEERRQIEEEERRREEDKHGEHLEDLEKVTALLEEVETLKDEVAAAEEKQWRLVKEEREKWEEKMNTLLEEKEDMRKKMDAEWREERQRWEERGEEEKKGLHSALRERVKRAEAEVESQLERLSESKRDTVKLQERIQDLEEELELDRRRVSEAEGVAKRAEEELTVAKERLLLQEDELQSRAEELLNRGSCDVCVCTEVEEMRSQLSRLQSRNRELELQSSGRNSDHARQIRQHAEALSSLRSEMVRAQTEELRRIQKHADDERDKLQKKIDKERETLQKEREQLKDQLEKERNRLRREKEEQKEWLHKEAEEVKEHLRREKEEEVDRLRKELEVDRVRVRSQLDKSIEQVEAEKIMVQQKLEDERRRLVEKAEEDRRRLKEQVRKAIEEVMRRHAAELHGVQEALSSEKKTNQEICARLDEERRNSEELRCGLEKEIEELRTKLKGSTNEVCRLESVVQQRENKEKAVPEAVPSCGPHCSRLEEELHQTRSRLARTQEEAERQKDRQLRDIASLRADKHRLEEKVLEQSRLNTERSLLDQSQRHSEERIRAECEDQLRAEFRIEMNAAVAESEQRWQTREQELQTQISELQGQLTQEEQKKEGQNDDSHGNPEIDRLRKEVQDTKEINKKLRDLLQEPQSQCLTEERHSHAVALQTLERQAKEDLLSERNRLQTMHHLELEKQRAELNQQHTEWSRQMTQRHMQQIEDLQAQLQAHTQMMALQQDLKQQNQHQVFERQLDESRCAIQELQRENATLKKQLKEKTAQKNPEAEEKEEEMTELRKKRDAQLEEEAQRLKEEVEKLRVEMEKLEESQKHWEERKEEDIKEEELDEEKRKEREEEKRKEEVEEIRREHKREMQSLVSEYSSAQSHLQARIVALENELREREERCRRREPRCDDLQLGRLQERLSERDQLIKRLVEERHQLQLHPPVSGDSSTLRPRDSKTRPGSVTPTMRRKLGESPPRVTSAGLFDKSIFQPPSSSSSSSSSSNVHQHSSTLPHPSSSHPQTSPHYSTSSLPHKHTSLSLGQHSSPSFPRSNRSRTSCIPPTPAPTAPLPVCPSPQTGIRYVSPSCQEPHAYLQAHSMRGPYLEPRGTEGLKQEWFTKYFSF